VTIEKSLAELLRFRAFLHTLCIAVTLTFDLLTLHFYSTLSVIIALCSRQL